MVDDGILVRVSRKYLLFGKRIVRRTGMSLRSTSHYMSSEGIITRQLEEIKDKMNSK